MIEKKMGLKKYLQNLRLKNEIKLKQRETEERYNKLTPEEVDRLQSTWKQAYMNKALEHAEIIGNHEAQIDFPLPNTEQNDEVEYQE